LNVLQDFKENYTNYMGANVVDLITAFEKQLEEIISDFEEIKAMLPKM